MSCDAVSDFGVQSGDKVTTHLGTYPRELLVATFVTRAKDDRAIVELPGKLDERGAPSQSLLPLESLIPFPPLVAVPVPLQAVDRMLYWLEVPQGDGCIYVEHHKYPDSNMLIRGGLVDEDHRSFKNIKAIRADTKLYFHLQWGKECDAAFQAGPCFDTRRSRYLPSQDPSWPVSDSIVAPG